MALVPLKILDVQQYIDIATDLESQADAFSKLGAPKLPGVPDVKEKVRGMLEAEKDKIVEKGRQEAIALLVLIMSAGLAKLAELEPEINAIIKVINKIIEAIGVAIKVLAAVAIATFAIIIALTIIFVVMKIIGMIPSIAIAFGTGISLDMPKFIATETSNMASFLLTELWPIASTCLATIWMLLKIYGMFAMIMGILKMFGSGQATSFVTAEDAFNKSADDWANTSLNKGDMAEGVMVECTLPNGKVAQMTPEDCSAAGGTFGEMGLLKQLNDINKQMSDINGMLGSCLLPDGSVSQMTPEDCAAAGGVFGGSINPNLCWDGCQHGLDLDGSKLITCQLPDGSNEDITLNECNKRNGIDLSVANINGLLNDLKNKSNEVCKELGPLCDYQLNDNIITSLLYSNDGATIEDATKDTGKRKGFYQSDIKQ
tara:strand:+ start:1612 stop:2898 length:1287 start_codon:yes stop_codon:yes gene_type:complete